MNSKVAELKINDLDLAVAGGKSEQLNKELSFIQYEGAVTHAIKVGLDATRSDTQ